MKKVVRAQWCVGCTLSRSFAWYTPAIFSLTMQQRHWINSWRDWARDETRERHQIEFRCDGSATSPMEFRACAEAGTTRDAARPSYGEGARR